VLENGTTWLSKALMGQMKTKFYHVIAMIHGYLLLLITNPLLFQFFANSENHGCLVPFMIPVQVMGLWPWTLIFSQVLYPSNEYP
jgi:hypothetical protein